eukprot:299809-Pyramimonas_sp.AAC.1
MSDKPTTTTTTTTTTATTTTTTTTTTKEVVTTVTVASTWSGLTDNSRLGHFFSDRAYLGGELNSPVVERLNKGLTAAQSPTLKRFHSCRGSSRPAPLA